MLLALAAVAAVAVLIWAPPSFVGSWLADDEPSDVAGQAVPAITETPRVRLAVVGDTGTGDAAQRATVRRMVLETRGEPYDALLVLGDMIYEHGDAAEVDTKITEPFAPVTDAGAELLPVLGNHDVVSGEQEEILGKLGRDSPWYVDQIGPLRVVVLDSNQVDNAGQTRWLRDRLRERQPRGTWTIVAMHHPAYSAGEHGSDVDIQQTWSPLFAEYDVPLVLAGHDHDYQRSIPQQGVTYVVSGAGAKLRPTGAADFTAVSTSTLHYLDLLVYEDRLVGRSIDQSGQLIDMFTIEP